jgi:hypothetical protein
MFFQYTHYNKNNEQRVAGINTDFIANYIFHEDELGEITACQILLNVPTTSVWREVPEKAKIDKNGNIIINKQGFQEVGFTRKQEQQHIIINILKEDEMKRFAEFVGAILDGKKFSSLLTAPEVEVEGNDLSNEPSNEEKGE